MKPQLCTSDVIIVQPVERQLGFVIQIGIFCLLNLNRWKIKRRELAAVKFARRGIQTNNLLFKLFNFLKLLRLTRTLKFVSRYCVTWIKMLMGRGVLK